jgi:DNA repair exonuclease SbcCD nuclease subunit
MNSTKIKLFFLIGDMHFGRYLNAEMYVEHNVKAIEFVRDQILKLGKDIDVSKEVDLIFKGDINDAKTYQNTVTQNETIDAIRMLTDIVHHSYFLVGNHDTPNVEDVSINSLKPISLLPNVTIVDKPLIIENEYAKLGLIPHMRSLGEFKANLRLFKEEGVKYGFGHNSVYGFKYDVFPVKKDTAPSIEDFEGFLKFYMGHIHMKQEQRNVSYIGSLLQIREKEASPKAVNGITILDIERNKEIFVENTISPKYKALHYDDLMDMKISEIKEFSDNSFIKVLLPRNEEPKEVYNIQDVLDGNLTFNFQPIGDYIQELDDFGEEINEQNFSYSIEETYALYINSISYVPLPNKMIYEFLDQKDKEKTISYLENLHKDCVEKIKKTADL